MRKKILITTITVLLISTIFTTPSFTQSYSRSITAWFNNLTLEVDGVKANLKNEPFIYNNEVYVPLRELSDHVMFNYQHDEKSKTLKLKTNRNNNKAVDNYQHNYEVIDLRNQIVELQKEIDKLQDGKFPYRKISTTLEMENYLKEHFKKLKDVPMNIRFRHKGGNKYDFSAVFSSNDLNKWNSLSRRDIENWVDDIFYVTRDLFNRNAEIEGDFRLTAFNTGIRYANYWTRGNRLFFDYKLADHKKNQMVDGTRIENALNLQIKHYHNASFTYKVFVNQSDIDIVVSYNHNFNNWTPALKMQYLTRLRTEVEKLYDSVSVNGRVVNSVTNQTELRFSFEGEDIRSVDLLNDLEKHLNLHYKHFYYGGHTLTFTYRVNESYSGSFEVIMEGNFTENSEAWQQVRNGGEVALRYFIQSSFDHIESVWDVDIFGTVRDKNLNSIGDVEYFSTSQYGIRIVQPIIFQ